MIIAWTDLGHTAGQRRRCRQRDKTGDHPFANMLSHDGLLSPKDVTILDPRA